MREGARGKTAKREEGRKGKEGRDGNGGVIYRLKVGVYAPVENVL